MKLQFLGTGAAEGVPAIFCQCDTCKEIRRRGEQEYHTRSQYIIDGVLGIEFPPDAYYHALRFDVNLSKVRHLLVTHSHMDHFYAHDFILRGYKYADGSSQPLTIYGNADVLKVFEECTKREMKEVVANHFTLVEVFPFRPFTCGEKGEYKVTPLEANHGKEKALLYLIEKGKESYLHLTDTGILPNATLDYLEDYLKNEDKQVDFVTFDCTFLYAEGGAGARHMGLADNKRMQEEFLRRKIANEHTRYAITHYSHNSSPFRERLQNAEKQYGYLPTYDGLTVDI